MAENTYFPFSAVVGQEDLKDALLCNAVNPEIGGVLIAGTRGTAKSTAVRSLAHLLPRIQAVSDCPYHCPPDLPGQQCEQCRDRDFTERSDRVTDVDTPFVNLPIGATEDRVLGTFNFESAIKDGERAFEPGLLARANRGILYVDEVNLLADHLIDVLLDAVASGVNHVEREGISFEHPADVLLVGTMNPEEGELRPQLLDRFGLYVEMDRDLAPNDRKAVVRRRTRFDENPQGMMADWAEDEAMVAARIESARATLPDVTLGDEQLDIIVDICTEHGVDGLRADIIIHRTARALAALDTSHEVSESHVLRAAELALGHRSNHSSSGGGSGPDSFGDTSSSQNPPDSNPDMPDPGELPGFDDPSGTPSDEEPSSSQDMSGPQNDGCGTGATEDHVFPITTGVRPPQIESSRRVKVPESTGVGGRSRTSTGSSRGAYFRARRPSGRVTDVALDATIRAAAPHQNKRPTSDSELAVVLRPRDFREKQRQSCVTNLVVFVVDSSGSMGSFDQMSVVKGSILSLVADSYHNRDHVSLVGFRKNKAEVVLPPTANQQRAARALAQMPTGGRTPLAAGLERGLAVIENVDQGHNSLVPVLVVVTDGRSNYARDGASPIKEAMEWADRIRGHGVSAVCFDTESGPVRLGIVRELADQMGAKYFQLAEFDSASISDTVQEMFSSGTRIGS